MKMGKILFKQAPLELYKQGEEKDYFYIILFGFYTAYIVFI